MYVELTQHSSVSAMLQYLNFESLQSQRKQLQTRFQLLSLLCIANHYQYCHFTIHQLSTHQLQVAN